MLVYVVLDRDFAVSVLKRYVNNSTRRKCCLSINEIRFREDFLCPNRWSLGYLHGGL